MPCRSDYDDCVESSPPSPPFEALLCGLSSVLEGNNVLNDVLNEVDWDEVGATRLEYEEWWKEHQERDAKRREEEEKAHKKQLLMQSALEKLTPEEREALFGPPKNEVKVGPLRGQDLELLIKAMGR